MINHSFNQEVNFSNSKIDISGVNKLYKSKKQQIEKELNKYKVDPGTKAKALNMQHLTQMPYYMPLFTKKIKDPNVMNLMKSRKDLDYSSKKESQKVQN